MNRRVRTAFGVVLSLLLLAWAVRDVSPAEVFAQVRGADPVLFILAVLVTLGGMCVRAVRWGILLRPVEPDVPLRPRVAATFIGFAANNVLPARIGEFARAFSLARLASIPASSAFATLVVERLLDGLALVGLLFAAMAAPGFPASAELGGVDLQAGAITVAIIIGGVALALGFAVAAPGPTARLARFGTRLLPPRLRPPLIAALRGFARGLAILRSPALFVVSSVLAVAQWLFLAASFSLAFHAFGIDVVPFSGAVFLQSMISLAVAIPSSPGFFGPFEAAARLGLGLWGVPADRAVAFAIGFHIGGFIPVTLLGLYYVWRMGLRWSDVRHSETSVETAVPPGPPSPEAGGAR